MPDVGIHRKGEVDLQSLLVRLRRNLSADVGAIASFIGVIRGISADGEAVRCLQYEAAEEAEKRLEEIARDIEKRPNIKKVMIHHVVDQISPGEDAIYVLVAGVGRADVFRALPEIMDRVKTGVPIWKKEVTCRRERWGHEHRYP